MRQAQGRVKKFGDNIDTDTITPGYTLQLAMSELKKHAFEAISPQFYELLKKGAIIVAGHNFGCGSSREQATAVLKELGINFIVCESMARIYFRNCVALGIYPVVTRGVCDLFKDGDTIHIDFEQGLVRNPATNAVACFEPLSGPPKEIVNEGGILPVLRKITEERCNGTK